MTETFLSEIRSAAAPLVERFNLREVSASETSQRVSMRYADRDRRVGIEFAVDWADLSAFVTLFELTSQGGFIDRYDPAQEDLVRRSAFDADDVFLARKAPSDPMSRRLRRKAPGEAKRLIAMYVEALSSYAPDVLEGDFSIFDELDRVVSERVRAQGRSGAQ